MYMFKTKPIQLVQEDSEDLIQLINPEQDSDLKPEDLPGELSILPIKNTVLFPGGQVRLLLYKFLNQKTIFSLNDNRSIPIRQNKHFDNSRNGTCSI